MTDAAAATILWTFVGYQWGSWIAEGRARKAARTGDACFQLLYRMVSGIVEKRRFTGRYLELSITERFECVGEKFALTLKSEGDPRARAETKGD